jgi:hypothetical protein
MVRTRLTQATGGSDIRFDNASWQRLDKYQASRVAAQLENYVSAPKRKPDRKTHRERFG